ncbi:MAG: hypothetical protein P8Z49_03580 [Acidobacteriota bacterium]|jgi:hypothetical protein
MITGYNQDVNCAGKVYHVQTEDRGEKNPVIETLIYQGGEILASLKTPYQDMLKKGCKESDISALLERQHRKVVVEIKLGKYAKEGQKAFGEGIISSKSLDEVILEYLTSESNGEQMTLMLLDETSMTAGESATLRLQAVTDITQVPVVGAEVLVTLVATDGGTSELFRGKTDRSGICAASFRLPQLDGNAAVVVDVEKEGEHEQLKSLVRRKE